MTKSKKRRPTTVARPRTVPAVAAVQAHAHEFTDVDSRLLTAVSRAHRVVVDASSTLEAVTAARGRTIRDARAAGATWTEIASVLGVSPQAVSKRYAGAAHTEDCTDPDFRDANNVHLCRPVNESR